MARCRTLYKMKDVHDTMSHDVICRNRIYKCLGCGFVGREEKADEHQAECDNPMELIS